MSRTGDGLRDHDRSSAWTALPLNGQRASVFLLKIASLVVNQPSQSERCGPHRSGFRGR